MKKKTPHTPQKQFKGGYVARESVQDHSMDNREAASPSAQRKRDSLQMGSSMEARPGMSGIAARTKLGKAVKTKSLRATG